MYLYGRKKTLKKLKVQFIYIRENFKKGLEVKSFSQIRALSEYCLKLGHEVAKSFQIRV